MSIFRSNPEIIPSFTGNPATGGGIAVPAGAQWWGRPYSISIDATLFNVPIIRGGVLYSLYVRTSGGQPIDNSMSINLYVGGIASTLLVTIPAGGAGGNYTDLINAVSIKAGDFVRYSLLNLSAAPSAPVTGIFMLLG